MRSGFLGRFGTIRLIAGLSLPLSFGGAACGESSEPSGSAGGEPADDEARVIYPLEELAPVADESDPFADHRPASVSCDEISGWYREEGGLEVDTASCNYFAMREGAITAARAGELLELTLAYFDLTAPEPAEAHVALLVDGALVHEEFIAIPGPGAARELSLPLPRDVAVGAPLEIHLHNHGQNTWMLAPVTVRPAD